MTKLESGRSMVEMLGVLAIIGVLSIGGIMGYQMAMNRYRANNILSTVAQVATIAETGSQGAGVAVADGLTATGTDAASLGLATGGTISATAAGVVTVTGVSTADGIGKSINSVVPGACDATDCAFQMTNGKLVSAQ